MNTILDELAASLPNAQETVRVVIRMLAALLAGGIIGLQREVSGKAAGLRTHMLVCAGTTLFVLAAIDAGMEQDALSRVIQGLVTGIGFLGAGAIMRTGVGIRGLTTASMIWVNAAIGVAVGGGEYRLAIIATGVTLLVLVVLTPVERWIERRTPAEPQAAPPPAGAVRSVESPAGQPLPTQEDERNR
jgi:putative Mg2+ transporter-C (MgtC) family protein